MTDPAPLRLIDHPILGPIGEEPQVHITFDGQPLVARASDTIASALLSHGIRTLRTLPESDAPRGFFCGTGRCPDCAVVVDGALNVPACTTPVRDGMVVASQRGNGEWGAS